MEELIKSGKVVLEGLAADGNPYAIAALERVKSDPRGPLWVFGDLRIEWMRLAEQHPLDHALARARRDLFND